MKCKTSSISRRGSFCLLVGMLIMPSFILMAATCVCDTVTDPIKCGDDDIPATCNTVTKCVSGQAEKSCIYLTNWVDIKCDYDDGTGFCTKTYHDCTEGNDPCGS